MSTNNLPLSLGSYKISPWMAKREISEKYWLEFDDALDGF